VRGCIGRPAAKSLHCDPATVPMLSPYLVAPSTVAPPVNPRGSRGPSQGPDFREGWERILPNARQGLEMGKVRRLMGEARRELRVLVADDDEAIRLTLGDVLKRAGCRVHTASDGIEAVRILEAVPVDLLITDYDMPRMSGLELIRWCQAILPDLPTLLISGHDLQAVKGGRAKHGVHRVLQKPFTGEQLLCLVGELCGAELPV